MFYVFHCNIGTSTNRYTRKVCSLAVAKIVIPRKILPIIKNKQDKCVMIGLGLLLFVYTMIALYNDTPSLILSHMEAFERC